MFCRWSFNCWLDNEIFFLRKEPNVKYLFLFSSWWRYQPVWGYRWCPSDFQFQLLLELELLQCWIQYLTFWMCYSNLQLWAMPRRCDIFRESCRIIYCCGCPISMWMDEDEFKAPLDVNWYWNESSYFLIG